jgi:osmotically-inducible protein OsmY
MRIRISGKILAVGLGVINSSLLIAQARVKDRVGTTSDRTGGKSLNQTIGPSVNDREEGASEKTETDAESTTGTLGPNANPGDISNGSVRNNGTISRDRGTSIENNNSGSARFPTGNGTIAEDSINISTDKDITNRIRRQLRDQKTLSTYAKNVKIITSKGRVILKGEIDDTAERDRILEIASSIAGEGKVIDETVLRAGESN